MVQKNIEIEPGRDLVIAQEDLREAGLGRSLRLVIREGEIRILTEPACEEEKLLQELAGCLGQEPASDYDFGLKIGEWYETR